VANHMRNWIIGQGLDRWDRLRVPSPPTVVERELTEEELRCADALGRDEKIGDKDGKEDQQSKMEMNTNRKLETRARLQPTAIQMP